MATSVFPTVITTLVTSLKAASSLSTVTVFDGLEIDLRFANDVIVVGHDGNLDSDEVNAGSFRQQYHPLGAKNKIEDGSINCVLYSQTGATNMATLRARAFTILGDIETVIRNDASLGGVVQFANLEQGQASYVQSEQGGATVVSFSVTYQARI